MKAKFILVSILSVMTAGAHAQSSNHEESKGKAIINVFSNFHSGFGSINQDRGFSLERAYLGYEYKLSDGITIKGVTDIGKSSDVNDLQRIVYLKNAMITWKKNNLTLSGGLISTNQFGFQEKFWGNRYIMKSFQDEYKYGNSADLGLSASYKFAEWISADAIVVNGEGYKKLQVRDGLNYGLGVTVTPVKGLSLRIYGGINEASGSEGEKDIYNIASFVGYACSRFRVGAEYNMMLNSKFKDDADQSGVSVYSTVNLTKKANVFARYDNQFSKNDWNKDSEESTVTVGSEIKLGKFVKIAPNVRITMPKADGVKETYAGYLNCYFGI